MINKRKPGKNKRNNRHTRASYPVKQLLPQEITDKLQRLKGRM